MTGLALDPVHLFDVSYPDTIITKHTYIHHPSVSCASLDATDGLTEDEGHVHTIAAVCLLYVYFIALAYMY